MNRGEPGGLGGPRGKRVERKSERRGGLTKRGVEGKSRESPHQKAGKKRKGSVGTVKEGKQGRKIRYNKRKGKKKKIAQGGK